MSWNDFNNADDQVFDLIPKGTLVKVCMTIKPGGFNDPSKGWTGGWATQNNDTGSIYLNCEFVVLEGQYATRKIWSLIGLQSLKGSDWAHMGRAMIKAILNSARGFSSKDTSPAAQKARYIEGIGELNGLEFIARVDIETTDKGDEKNVIKTIITPDHKEYAALMGRTGVVASFSSKNPFQQSSGQSSSPGQSPSTPSGAASSPYQLPSGHSPVRQRPSWAE